MRMSNVAMNHSSINIVNATSIRYDNAVIQSTSGMKIQKAHENPMLAHKALQLENIKATNTQFNRNAGDAKSLINYTETMIGQVTDSLTKLRELMVQASSDTIHEESRQAIVQQVNQIIFEIGNLGNQQFNGKYIFAGTNTKTKPYEITGGDVPTGFVSNANNGEIALNVDTNLTMVVNIPGTEIFDTLIPDLLQIRDDIQAGNLTGIVNNGLADIDKHIDNTINKRTQLGAKANILDSAMARISASDYETQTTYSSLMGVDLTKTAIEMKSLEVSYHAGLSMIAKLHQMNLMDYVK